MAWENREWEERNEDSLREMYIQMEKSKTSESGSEEPAQSEAEKIKASGDSTNAPQADENGQMDLFPH